MGNFRSNNRGGFGGGRPSGSRFGGGSRGFRDRNGFGGGRERRPMEMHDVICDKCGKECQVPFKPTGDKPVYCSDCFKKMEGSNNNFASRNQSSQSGISSDQFNKLNTKLDKILQVLKELEIDVENSENDEDEEDLEEDMDEDSEDEDNSEEDDEDEEKDVEEYDSEKI